MTVAFLVLLAAGRDMASGIRSIDPGPLSAAHTHFAGNSACSTCHFASGSGARGWWDAFWDPTALVPASAAARSEAHRLTTACTQCHSFAGKETLAHNELFENRKDLGPTNCLMCHTEHKGPLARITTLTQGQCQTCHMQKTEGFALDHPKFDPAFPYNHPQAIRFDHAAHFGKHFTEPRMAALVPQGGCIGCHVPQQGKAIRPAAFETMCAGCHSEGIAKREFVLFRWPEIETNLIKPDQVTEACGLSGEALARLRGGAAQPAPAPAAFSAVSADPPTAIAAYLLGVNADSAADYEVPIQELAQIMVRSGADSLTAAAKARLQQAPTERLFAGLNPEQLRQAACAWAANQEYTPPGKTLLPGWRADGLELRYARPAHADPTLRAWTEAIATQPLPATADEKLRLQAARKEMLSPSDGPGQCTKCHTVSDASGGSLTVNWRVTLRGIAPHTKFDHRPHLDLLGPEKTCTSCHALADGPMPPSAAGAGLKPITLATCTTCHSPGKVRDDCQLCHVYHQDHAFIKRMMTDAK